jgi:hypothetical protein
MNKNFIITSLAAGITLFALGAIFYALLLADYFTASAPADFYKDPPEFLLLVPGELLVGSAITLAVVTWGGAKDLMEGLKAGAILGLLVGLGFNLSWYATSNIGTLNSGLVDAAVTVIRFGLTAGVAALVMSKLSGSDD